MQSLALLVLGLVVAPAASSSVSAHGALSAAKAWLRSHSGSPDELAALKGANPEAYSLVKALLSKQTLGLLDPKHPSGSLSKEERGPEVYEQFATPGELSKVSVPYAEVQASAHQDWLSWKPPSTTDDDALVDPEHHSESLSKEERSPEVYEQFATPGELSLAGKVSVPYVEVQASAHQDWLSWKPQSTTDEDGLMENVLGAVAEVKAKKTGFMSTRSSVDARSSKSSKSSFAAAVQKELRTSKNSKSSFATAVQKELRSSKNSFAAAVQKEVPQRFKRKAKVVKPVLPTVPTRKQNSWMDFSMVNNDHFSADYKPLQVLQVAPAEVTPAKENSYLKRFAKPDMTRASSEWKMLTVEPAEVIQPKNLKLLKVTSSVATGTGPNYLNSFSWDKAGDSDAQSTKQVLSHMQSRALHKKAKLMSWLHDVKKAPASKKAQTHAKPPTSAKKPGSTNRYMQDLTD